MHNYINYYFRNLSYDDDVFTGEFESADFDIRCKFIFRRKTRETEIWDNNLPAEEILPLPVQWLEYKLGRDGSLGKNISRICY